MIDKTNAALRLEMPDMADGIPAHECLFCGWDRGRPEDYRTCETRGYAGNWHEVTKVELCMFCMASHAASGWCSGGNPEHADPRDMATFANMLLAEIRNLSKEPS